MFRKLYFVSILLDKKDIDKLVSHLLFFCIKIRSEWLWVYNALKFWVVTTGYVAERGKIQYNHQAASDFWWRTEAAVIFYLCDCAVNLF